MNNNYLDTTCLKPNESKIYAAMRHNLFSMSDSHFGQFYVGEGDNRYDIKCIEGASPKVYKPVVLQYCGYVVDSSANVHIHVFKKPNGESLLDRYLLRPRCFHAFERTLLDTILAYSRAQYVLDIEQCANTYEDCLKICRDFNHRTCNYVNSSDVCRNAKYYKKTLKKMQKELDDFLKSEYVVDHAEMINKELKD